VFVWEYHYRAAYRSSLVFDLLAQGLLLLRCFCLAATFPACLPNLNGQSFTSLPEYREARSSLERIDTISHTPNNS
jgi:hypothetical protein